MAQEKEKLEDVTNVNNVSKKKYKFKGKTFYEKRFKLYKEKFNTIEAVILVGIGGMLGILIGEIIFSTTSASKNKYINEITKTYSTIIEGSYDDIDEETLKEYAIKGMLSALEDDYTNYLEKEEQEEFNEQLNGTYKGLGIQMILGTENIPIIYNVYDDSPAAEADLQKNDQILEVNGVSTKDKTLSEVADLVKNKSLINIKIKRNDQELEKEIILDTVEIPSVSSEIINDEIGYIKISLFAKNTDEQFKKELAKIKEKEINKLIIDVRSNSGGHLDSAESILNEFLNKKDVLYQLKTKDEIKKVYGKSGEKYEGKIVVLGNGSSASASELLMAGLKDNERATIVGKTSYGKGSVQETVTLSDGSMIKYTKEMWLTPKGISIDKTGIKPDKEVNQTKEYYENPSIETDNQLQTAIKLFQD